MNTILEKVIEARNGLYCHAIEVESVYEIQSIIDAAADEFKKTATIEELKEFFNTIEIYCLDEDSEEEVYSFDTAEYIDSLI